MSFFVVCSTSPHNIQKACLGHKNRIWSKCVKRRTLEMIRQRVSKYKHIFCKLFWHDKAMSQWKLWDLNYAFAQWRAPRMISSRKMQMPFVMSEFKTTRCVKGHIICYLVYTVEIHIMPIALFDNVKWYCLLTKLSTKGTINCHYWHLTIK